MEAGGRDWTDLEPKVPVTLITGSLGSGKTTLLRQILLAEGVKLAVVMNEFGEMAIDGEVIRGENIQMIELTGGCVCCSLTGEFEAAVREILEKVRPELILVEATGVAEADALVFEVEDSLPEVRLDTVISIVDAYLSIRHPHVGYTTRTQLEVADIVLINKVDLVSADELRTVEAQVREYNETALIFPTSFARVDVHLLFGLDAGKRPLPVASHVGPHFQSFAFTTERLLDEGLFEEFVRSLPASVLRAKGFVRFDGLTRLFNYVAGRADFEDFEAQVTQLVFIGIQLDKDRDSLLAGLKACTLP